MCIPRGTGKPGRESHHLAAAPHDWQSRLMFIESLIKQQRITDAERELSSMPNVVGSEVVDSALRGCIGVVREDWPGALKMLADSYQRGFRSPLQMHSFSEALIKTGQWQAAEAILRDQLKISPHDTNVQANLQFVLSQQDR